MNEKSYIKRSKHDKQNPYFLMVRGTAQDRTLSFEARGLLAYLLSKPDDWRVELSDLRQNCGRDKARTILNELVKKGYAQQVEQSHDPLTGRFTGGDYEIAETPIFEPITTETPCTEKPLTVSPYTVNPTQHNTEKKHKKEKELTPNGVRPPSKPKHTDIIKAWLDAQGSKNSGAYKNKTIQESAKALFDDGITASDVTAFTLAKKQDAFWVDKFIGFEHVANDILAWKQNHKPAAPLPVVSAPEAPDMTPTFVPAYMSQNGSNDHD